MSMMWVVIYGANVPQEEIDNSQLIADKLSEEGKITRVLPDNDPRLFFFHLVASFICVGGPGANKWTNRLDGRCNPRGNIVYNEAGGIVTDESSFVKDVEGEVRTFPMLDHGIIGVGKKLRPRLEIYSIWGYALKDTTAVVKAFLADSESGVYYTPSSSSYTLVGCRE